jgi:hypothetical protein
MNDKFVEWQIIIKFLIKLNRSVSEISDKLKQAYGDDSPSRPCVSKWAKGFWKGDWTCKMLHGWATNQLPTQTQDQKGENVTPI